MSTSHEAVLYLKITLNPQGFAVYSPLPDSSARSIIPLNDLVLYPKDVAAYVTCCQAHANSLMTPFFTGSTETPMNPVPSHRPAILLHSAHVRQHYELDRPSDARRHAIIWSNSRRPLIFSFNEIICPCCPQHAQQLHIVHRDTFSAYNDEIEEMNPRTMQTVVRTETPTPEEYHESVTSAIPPPSLITEPAPSTRHTSPHSVSSNSFVMIPPAPSSSALVSSSPARPPTHQPLPALDTPVTATQPPARPRSVTPRPIIQTQSIGSRSQTTLTEYEAVLRHESQSYVSATNRAPIPVASRPPARRPNHHTRPLHPTIEAMTADIPRYVLDPSRELYTQHFESIATILRIEMLLCLHVLDYPSPSNDAIAAARSLLVSDIQVDYNLYSVLGNYTVATYFFTEHLQDYHTHAIRSSSDSLLDDLVLDAPNCGILRCIFYYREGPNVDATVYLTSFNPLNSYYMILTRLNETVLPNTPKLKVTIEQTHPSSKCYRLPPNHFDVDLKTRDPSTLSEVPMSMRHSHHPPTTSSRSSVHSSTRRPLRPRAP
jgi:hypothetical protein